MKDKCFYCYNSLNGETTEFHPACSQLFFGTPVPPTLEYTNADMKKLAAERILDRIAVTGAQPKISLTINKEKDPKTSRLTIVGLWGDFILKPPSELYPSLPENEDITMHLAELLKIKTAFHSLIRLKSGELAYITRRFDRVNKTKLALEDLCQLTETLTSDKYKGSYERTGKKIAEFSDQPKFDLLSYFEIILFSFICGNADMHLKNFSLLTQEKNNITSLAPAYDLLSTRIAIPEDKEEMALFLNGKKNRINRSDFDKFAETLGLEKRAVQNIYEKFASSSPSIIHFLDHGFLLKDQKEQYQDLVIKNVNALKLSIGYR